MEVVDVGSPLTLLIGDASPANVEIAARVTARYSAAKHDPQVKVVILSDPDAELLVVEPASPGEFDQLRVGEY